jgi:hypothetical protein
MMMDKKIINKISKTVYQQFPEMQGSQPRVRSNYGPQAKSIKTKPTVLLTYRTMAKNPNGQKIPRQVRVVANEKGKILRISTSR